MGTDDETGKTSVVRDGESESLFEMAELAYERTDIHLPKIIDLLGKVSSDNGIRWVSDDPQPLQKTVDSIASDIHKRMTEGMGADPHGLDGWAETTFILDESNIGNLGRLVDGLKPYLRAASDGSVIRIGGKGEASLNLDVDGIPVEIRLETSGASKDRLVEKSRQINLQPKEMARLQSEFKEDLRKIDYSSLKYEFVSVNGDELSYVVQDEKSEPLFDQARKAIELGKETKPRFVDFLKVVRNTIGGKYELDFDSPSASKGEQSLATKLVKKNRDKPGSYTALMTKDLNRNTLTLPDEKITNENLNKVLEIAKDKGFEPTLEIKRLDDDPDNPYLGIQISLKDTNGTYSELQVSTASLFKVKKSTEAIYKDIGSLGKSDEHLRKKKDLVAKMRKIYSDFLTGNTPLQSFFASSNGIKTLSSQSSTTYSEGPSFGSLDQRGPGRPVENQPLSDLKNKLPMPRSLSNQSTKKYSPGLSENSAMPQSSVEPTIAQNGGEGNGNGGDGKKGKDTIEKGTDDGEIEERSDKKNIKRFKADNGDTYSISTFPIRCTIWH